MSASRPPVPTPGVTLTLQLSAPTVLDLCERMVDVMGQLHAIGQKGEFAPLTHVTPDFILQSGPGRTPLYELTWERSEVVDWRGTIEEFLAENMGVPADFVEQLRALPLGGSLDFEGGSAEWTMRRVA